MRCHICNATLSAAEVQWNSDHKDWDPCNKCQEVIEGVFSDLTEEEIDGQLVFEFNDEEIVSGNPGEENT